MSNSVKQFQFLIRGCCGWLFRSYAGLWPIFLIGIIYLFTAEYIEVNQDCLVAALPSWKLANYGTFILDEFNQYPGIRESNWGRASIVGPLLQLISYPMYLLFPSTTPIVFPSTLVAILSTTLAIFFFYRLMSQSHDRPIAIWATFILALCTPIWGVAAKQLWSHSLTILWLILAFYFLRKKSYLGAGIMFALCVLTRQIAVVIPLTLVALLLVQRVRLRSVLEVAIPTILGLLLTFIINFFLWGRLENGLTDLFTNSGAFLQALAGGYGKSISSSVSSGVLLTPGIYLERVIETFVGPHIGLLIWTPFLLILLPGIVSCWSLLDPLARSLFLSGLVYILVHLLLNRASGGMVFNYRYPLESLMLASPLLVGVYQLWTRQNRLRIRLFCLSIIVSFAIQAVYAINHHCVKDEFSKEGEVSCYILRIRGN